MTTPAYRRLLRDFKSLTADSVEGVAAAPMRDDLFHWSAIALGPVGSPWEDGVWKIDMAFPPDYPKEPPAVRFRNEIFHPNVFPDGRIGQDVLRGHGWAPLGDVRGVLLAIKSLFVNMDAHVARPEGNANPDADILYAKDKVQYNARIKALVDKQVDEDKAEMGPLTGIP